MKISDLIAQLQAAQSQYGDLPVCYDGAWDIDEPPQVRRVDHSNHAEPWPNYIMLS